MAGTPSPTDTSAAASGNARADDERRRVDFFHYKSGKTIPQSVHAYSLLLLALPHMHPRNLRKHLSIEQRVRHREGAARERRKGQVVVEEVLAELQARAKVDLVVCDVCPVDEIVELGLRLCLLSGRPSP